MGAVIMDGRPGMRMMDKESYRGEMKKKNE
jgi:hypothetical protein